MKKARTVRSSTKQDEFATNKIEGEYSPEPPRLNADAAVFVEALSKLSKRSKTGFVTNWRPPWIRSGSFGYFFFEDGLAVDLFGREDGKELDALADDLTQAERQEIAGKTVACAEHGIKYLFLGPDDELDAVGIAAKIGKTSFKKSQEVA